MEKVLVVGLGEVGRPLFEIVRESGRFETYGYDVDPSKTVHRLEEIPEKVDYLHVCIPCKDKWSFLKSVELYVRRFRPKLVVVHSTVVPGTCRLIHEQLNVHVVHSPVRGVHAKMKEHLRFWTKWIGPVCEECRSLGETHLRELGFNIRIAKNAETTELAKIWETVMRAVLITTWHDIHRTCREFMADIGEVAEFIGEVHEVLKDRPVYYPGVIGGHCLIPNTRLLLQVYYSPLLEYVLESNEVRRIELEHPDIKQEVEKVKKVWERYINRNYFY